MKAFPGGTSTKALLDCAPRYQTKTKTPKIIGVGVFDGSSGREEGPSTQLPGRLPRLDPMLQGLDLDRLEPRSRLGASGFGRQDLGSRVVRPASAASPTPIVSA